MRLEVGNNFKPGNDDDECEEVIEDSEEELEAYHRNLLNEYELDDDSESSSEYEMDVDEQDLDNWRWTWTRRAHRKRRQMMTSRCY